MSRAQNLPFVLGADQINHLMLQTVDPEISAFAWLELVRDRLIDGMSEVLDTAGTTEKGIPGDVFYMSHR